MPINKMIKKQTKPKKKKNNIKKCVCFEQVKVNVHTETVLPVSLEIAFHLF